MSDETKNITSPPAPETLAITPDEFAVLKAKAEKAEQLEAQVTAIKQQADQLATDLTKVTHARRHDQLLARYEAFVALPEKPATLADKMQALDGIRDTAR